MILPGMDSLTRTDIEGGLRRLGIGKGSVLEVHSSLRSLGRVEGGATAVVDALLEVAGPEGAIVMSAYPMSKGRPLTGADRARGITYKSEVLPDDSAEPTNLGAVVDEFKKRPGVRRGRGDHAGAAWGRDADIHCLNYDHLVKTGGMVLLIGVGIGSCSSMHIPEYSVGVPAEIAALSMLPSDVRRDFPPERWYVECDRVPGTPRNAWSAVWEEVVAGGLVTTGRIGEAECHLFRAADAIGIFERRLRTDPWELYGVPKPA